MKRYLTVILLAGLASLTATLALAFDHGQSPAAVPPALGSDAPGQIAYELIGRIDQNGSNFTGYGYLTYIQGLPDSLLFTDPFSRTESTARFTFAASSTLTARSVISSVFVINSTGPLTFYLDEAAGANFDDPQSFRQGTVIATATARFHDVLNVQSPNRGIATGVGEINQLTAAQFTLGGQTYQMGRAGLLSQIEYTGEGIRTEPTIPLAMIVLAGHATVTGQRMMMPFIARDSRP